MISHGHFLVSRANGFAIIQSFTLEFHEILLLFFKMIQRLPCTHGQRSSMTPARVCTVRVQVSLTRQIH